MDVKFQLGSVAMEVSKNQIFQNKTRKYLLPILKEYGDIFTGKFNSIFKVACGIGDIVIENSGINYERHLFILVDTVVAHKFFNKFLDWVKTQPYYEDDYVYGNIQKSRLHMIVLKIPEKFYESLETFKKGKYSKMYNYESIEKYFNNHPDIKRVLIRDHNYKLEFIGKLNKEFGTDITDFTIEDYELDLPIDNKEEKFK
jgi:hypothetical protein